MGGVPGALGGKLRWLCIGDHCPLSRPAERQSSDMQKDLHKVNSSVKFLVSHNVLRNLSSNKEQGLKVEMLFVILFNKEQILSLRFESVQSMSKRGGKNIYPSYLYQRLNLSPTRRANAQKFLFCHTYMTSSQSSSLHN